MSFIKRQSLHERKVGDKSFVLTADGNIEINLATGKQVKVAADMVVTGANSGPKTQNVYYVTEEGSDTNTGLSSDKNGAFASIKQAAETAPTGSTIIVAPGDYYENNPITLKDFVTVTGQGELRNTRIFPKNDTSTIFYMGNACYLYQLTFRALRYPGWCAEIREGALVTTSPYVQNCTNMNGPWLNDGTEFIPFQTVQLAGITPGARPLEVADYPELETAKQINLTGGGGGMLVDGDKYNPASLVFSFVADAFTQIAQGGIGFHITNFGYTQIVSCFTVFCSTGFMTTKGGYLSISNSVSDFGTNAIIADGYYPIAYTQSLPKQNYFSTVGSVTIKTAGSGYTSAPTVQFDAPTGAGGVIATATAAIDATTGKLAGITINTNGSGYESVPLVSFVGGDPTVAGTGEVNLTTNQSIQIASLRDKPQTGSVIKFDNDSSFYYITGSSIEKNPFTYNEETCKRDVRRIVDAVLGDIVMGTNYQSITAAQSYLRATASKVILDQLSPTVYGIESARDEMKALTTNIALEQEIDNRFAIITSVLSAGDSTGIPDIIYNDLSSINEYTVNAKDNVVINRDFIIAELTAYINDQFTELSYNQTEFTNSMKDFLTGVAYYAVLGSNHHAVRAAQEYTIRSRFETLTLSAIEYLRNKYTVLGSVTSSSVALANLNEAFNTIINILDDGDSAGITTIFPSHTGVEANRADSRDHLQANKTFIKNEFTAYLTDTYSTFTFTSATYQAVMENYVDALTYDIMYGGTSATIKETEYLYTNLSLSTLTATQRQNVEDAFARIRFVVARIVRGLSVTKSSSNVSTQDISSNNATQAEATELDTLVQITEAVISANSITGLAAQTYPLYASEATVQQTAAGAIISNRDTYITDTKNWILATYPDLTYDVTKCERDVGYIVDAIYRDAQLGTNHNSITAGLAYQRANVAYLNINQKPATIIAMREAKRLLVLSVASNTIFQTTVTNLFDDVLDIIEFNQQPSEGTVFPDPGPASQELINAVSQLVGNRDFLKAEINAYINANYFVYDSAKCSRDTGLIIDAARYDAAFGTNYNQVTAGLGYQRANSAYLQSNQKTETIAGITWAKGQAQTASSGDSTAQTRVGAAFDEVIDIITNGVVSTDTAADVLTFPSPTGASAAQIAAKDQLQNNRNFLAAEAVAYVQNNFQNYTYNRIKCERDVGLIMDGVALDIATGSNYNAVTAGLGYQRASSAELQDNQLLQTSGALRDLKKQIVLLGLSDNAEPRANAAMDEIIDILENGSLSTDTAADAITFPAPTGGDVNKTNAKAQLVANKEFIKDEIVAWLGVNYPSASYDSAKCERDVGYVVDAVCFDVQYGGNSATKQAAEAYFVGTVSQLASGQVPATAAAFNRLADVVGDIVVEAPVSISSGNSLTQNTAGTAASSSEADEVEGLVILVEDVITAGNIDGLPSTTLPSVTWAASDYQQAYNTIKGNKTTVQETISIFIANNYQSYSHDEAKCRADVAIMIDAAAYDATLGTNFNAITSGLAYQRANSSYVISNQNLQTIKAIEYVRDQSILLDIDSTFKTNITNAFNEILDIIQNGVVSTDTAADALTITDPNVDVNHIRAYNEIQLNRNYMAAEVVAWINNNYPSLVYDQNKCLRDTKYILDGLSYDILYGGNLASKQAAKSYFVGAVSQLASGQAAATIAAYNELSLILSDVIQNITHGSNEQAVVTQNTTGPGADAGTAGEVQNLIQIVEDVITAGNIDSIPADSTPSITWTSASAQADYATLVGAKATIQSLTTTFIDDTFTRNFTFNSAKCNRDTKYIVDALTYDILYGGNQATIDAASAYFVGTTSQVAGQQPETAAALGWVNTLLGSVIVDSIYADPEQGGEGQDVSGAGAGSSAEVTKASDLITIFKNVIENGTDNLPTKVYPDYTSTATSAIQAALGTLDSQKATIQSGTVDYINTTYTGFSYDAAKCARDTEYLINAVAHDALYTGNIATLIATRAYFLGAAAYIPASQKAATVAAYNHIKTVAGSCIEGVSVSPSTGNTESQFLGGAYGTSTEVGTTNTLFDITSTAINNQSLVGTPSEVEPNFSWLPVATRTSAATLLSSKASVQTGVITYITNNILGFNYTIEKCERDTGYVIDAVIYDSMYGGNKQSRRAGLAYYNNTIIKGQELITAYSYYYLGDILKSVANNDPITRSYNNVLTQDITIPDTLSSVGDNIKLLTDRLAKAIVDFSTVGWSEVNHNYELGSGVYNTERTTILASTETIVTNSIADLNAQFGGEATINVFPGIISVSTTQQANLYNVSTVSTSGHAFEYVGAGVTYNALPFFGGTAIPAKEIQELDNGKVFAGGTVDQIGNFRVGNFFGVNALTGSITLNANEIDLQGLTSVGPFIRNGIPVGVELKEVSDNGNLISSIGSQDLNTAPTQRAVSEYVENRYLNKLTGGTVTGNFVLNGDFDVNGNVLSTDVTGAFSLLNTNATEINIGGAATTINIGAATGTMTVNPDLVIDGSLTVNGDMILTGDVQQNIPDETLQAYSISTEGSLDYLSINTRTNEEKITFGIRPSLLAENTTESTSVTTGALVVDGGVGIAKSLYVGVNLTANGNIILGNDRAIDSIDIKGTTDIDVKDNAVDVFRIHENISDYISINTTDTAEVVEFGVTPNVTILNADDASSKTTGAVQVTGGISTQVKIHAGTDITADRDITAGRNLIVNGVSVTTDETGTFSLLNTNAATINAFGAATTVSIGAGTGTLTVNNEQVVISSTKTLQIPVGTEAQRPSAVTGQIRFNTTTTVFEGYDGIAWGALGGVKDVDQNTFIRPETSPGANNDELEFFTNGTQRAKISNTAFDLDDSIITTLNNTTVSTTFENGALVVKGGVGIAKGLHVKEYVAGNSAGVLQLTELESDKIVIKAGTIETPDQLKIVSNAPDSAADDIVYPLTLAHHSLSGTPTINSGTGMKFELETTNDNFETGAQIDVVVKNITGAAEDFDMVLSTMNNGSAGVEKLRLSETTSTFTTSLQVNQNLTVNGILDAGGITASVFADDSTEMLDAISNRLTVVTGQVGTLTLTADLEVQYGGTGASTFTTDGILYGNAANAVQVTAAAGSADASNSFQILSATGDADATPVWTDTIDGGTF